MSFCSDVLTASVSGFLTRTQSHVARRRWTVRIVTSVLPGALYALWCYLRWRRARFVLPQKRFGLSKYGFVPEESHILRELPETFALWEDTACQLGDLGRSRRIREVVDSWPLVDFESLDTGDGFSPSIRRAYTILAMVAHVYVWCDNEPKASLPAALSVPLHWSASRLGLPPVLTHAACDLWNWRTAHVSVWPAAGTQTCPDNLRCIRTMTCTRDEEWFYVCSTACQSLAGPSVLAAYVFLARDVPSQNFDAIELFL